VKWGKKQVTRKKGRHTIEEVAWPDVPSVQGNSPEWHCMNLKPPGDFIVPCLIDKRFLFAANPNEYPDTNMFFHGRFKERRNAKIGCAVLNSTITYLLAEIFGRGKGLGGLNLYGPELKTLPIPNPTLFVDTRRKPLLDAFQRLASREVKSIFVELGLPEPCTNEAHPYCNIIAEDLSLDNVLPDRRALDKIVFEALGLTEAEQLEVYRAVVELVKNRLVKAGSV